MQQQTDSSRGAARSTPDVNHSGLFISLLMRYPQIGSIRYVPAQRNLLIRFMLHQELSDTSFTSFMDRLRLSLEVYSELSGKPVHVLDVRRVSCAPFTALEVVRDIDTITREELSLIVGLVTEWYTESLVSEPLYSENEELLGVEDDLIEHMLDDVRFMHPTRTLIGFREHGRVIVRTADT